MSEPHKRKDRGRVDIIRQTAGRGGKTVTVVANFIGIGLPEKERLAKEIQKTCGTGGTVKDGRIETQGDKREEIARILTAARLRRRLRTSTRTRLYLPPFWRLLESENGQH